MAHRCTPILPSLTWAPRLGALVPSQQLAQLNHTRLQAFCALSSFQRKILLFVCTSKWPLLPPAPSPSVSCEIRSFRGLISFVTAGPKNHEICSFCGFSFVPAGPKNHATRSFCGLSFVTAGPKNHEICSFFGLSFVTAGQRNRDNVYLFVGSDL